MPIYRLDEDLWFPDAQEADEHGLVAVGGDLRPERLLLAYASGIFPWPHEGYPLLWFSPDPRMVLPVDEVRVSRRLRRTVRSRRFRVTLDEAFGHVIRGCAQTPRKGEPGTWITPAIIEAYTRLHDLGFAHSIECWQGKRLAGGLYGVCLGGVFIGESMFARVSDASKVALVRLAGQLGRWGIGLLDAQVATPHLARMGGVEWPRRRYLAVLREALRKPTRQGRWRMDDDLA